MTNEHRVWFTRYGVRHYYLATSREDADRWIRVYKAIGGVEINRLEFPDGSQIEMSGHSG
jgi:hypothetical protein